TAGEGPAMLAAVRRGQDDFEALRLRRAGLRVGEARFDPLAAQRRGVRRPGAAPPAVEERGLDGPREVGGGRGHPLDRPPPGLRELRGVVVDGGRRLGGWHVAPWFGKGGAEYSVRRTKYSARRRLTLP